MSPSVSNRLPRIAIVFSIVAISFSAIFVRLSDVHPVTIAFYRTLFASLILLPFVPSRWNEIKRLSKKEWLILASTGAILGIHFSLWIASLSYTSVASSSVIVTAHPLVVALIAGRYLGERSSGRAYLAILIWMAGISIMAFSDYHSDEWSLLGDGLAFVAMLAMAVYLVRGRQMRQKISLVTYVFFVYGFACVFLFPATIAFYHPFRIFPAREYILFAAMAIVPTMLGHTLYNWALEYVKARIVSVALLFEGVGSIILALLILGEVPPPFTAVGAAVALVGIYLCVRAE